MAAPHTNEAIRGAILKELEGTQYAASSLRALDGGSANFIYCATLCNPLAGDVREVTIKHGESYVAQHPDFSWSMLRCTLEVAALRLVANLPPQVSSNFEIRTPKLLHFNETTHNQVQEYLLNAVSLKNYVLDQFGGNHITTNPQSVQSRCVELGQCSGRWLRRFHEWSDHSDRSDFRTLIAQNTEMQSLKRGLVYDQLLWKVKKLPDVLASCQDVLQQVVDMASAELADESKLRIIHGDFWTGNILLPAGPFAEGQQVPVRIVDWEMAQLGVRPEDVGQLVAELWLLKLYKGIDAGLWILQGFVNGYGKVDHDFAFRALVHVGAHLICIGSSTPGWGSAEEGEAIARVGRDLLLAAWRKDLPAFKGHDLECLLWPLAV